MFGSKQTLSFTQLLPFKYSGALAKVVSLLFDSAR